MQAVMQQYIKLIRNIAHDEPLLQKAHYVNAAVECGMKHLRLSNKLFNWHSNLAINDKKLMNLSHDTFI